MMKYLVHAVGMFEDFKHYHISFVEQGSIKDEYDLHSIVTSEWQNDAENLIYNKVRKIPIDVYIVGFNVLSK